MQTTKRIGRREFVGASAAAVTVPLFVAACGSPRARQASVAPATRRLPANPFDEWFGIDSAVATSLMAALTERGADDAELYFQYSRNSQLSLEDGRVTLASIQVVQGVGLRVVRGGRTGFAYTEDLTVEAMLAAARGAAASVNKSVPAAVPANFTPRRHRGLYRVDVPWGDVGVEEKLPHLQRLGKLARAADPSIARVDANWRDVDERVMVVSLGGDVVVDRRPRLTIYVSVVAKKGRRTEEAYDGFAVRAGLDAVTDRRIGGMARAAVERALQRFDARRPPAGEIPVVLGAGESGVLLHEAIGHGLEADFNQRKLSVYSDKLGQRVAPEFVTVVDDGTLDREQGSLNVDDEGMATERTVLVENGILRSYLHDRTTARQFGLPASTGSGRRESFRWAPMPRMRCTTMLDGPHERDEIIASVKNGILAETFSGGEVKIGAGDFTFYVNSGRLIENGKLTAPIRDCNVIGNGPDVLATIKMAAADSRLGQQPGVCGKDGQSVVVSHGLPTVLVSMTVGGGDAHA